MMETNSLLKMYW